jgi:hypothetical protein
MAADQGKLTLLGLLDLSAAFDCVDHDILSDRLILSFGIASTVHCWICSYITGRYMRVKYNGSISELSPVIYGVPQGSVLGPLFFVMYTSDVFRIAAHHNFSIVHGYADDLQLYDHCLPNDIQFLATRFVRCVKDIQQLMTENRLRLNASKTEMMWIGSGKTSGRQCVDSCHNLRSHNQYC